MVDRCNVSAGGEVTIHVYSRIPGMRGACFIAGRRNNGKAGGVQTAAPAGPVYGNTQSERALEKH